MENELRQGREGDERERGDMNPSWKETDGPKYVKHVARRGEPQGRGRTAGPVVDFALWRKGGQLVSRAADGFHQLMGGGGQVLSLTGWSFWLITLRCPHS